MKKNVLQRFCNKGLLIISAICGFWILLLNIIYSVHISYDDIETVWFYSSLPKGIAFALIAIIAVIIFTLCKRYIEKIDEKKLFLFLSIIYGVSALYLILNLDHNLRADPYSVYVAALRYGEGSIESFIPSSYIYYYPYQLGMMTYDLILQHFSKDTSLLFVVNLLLVIGVNYFGYKISDLVFKSKLANVFTIVLSFTFLPQLFFVMFAYGAVPGLFFMIGGFYFTLKYVKTNKRINFILTLFFVAFAVVLKKNFLIGAIAIGIYILLMTKKAWWKGLILTLCIVCAITLPTKMLTGYYEYKTGVSLNQGVPAVMWVAMGTDQQNYDRAAGWYNGYNLAVYLGCGCDREATAEIGTEKLKSNLSDIKSNPADAVRFFHNKTVSQWCENSCQSIWVGPLAVCGQYAHTELLTGLYNGEEEAVAVEGICECITQIIWIFALLYLVLWGKRNDGWQLVFTYFIGGLIFHTLWEGKSQYIYPYVFCLIPFAGAGISYCVDYFEKRLKNVILRKNG